MEESNKIIKEIAGQEYKYGFTTDVQTDTIPAGLDESVVRLISQKKGEPEWMLQYRLKAFRHWLTMKVPTWAHLDIPEIDFQSIIYYAAPKKGRTDGTVDDIDPELKKTFDKLGIPLEEQLALSGVAVDAVMDSVSVKTTFKETLAEKGIIFCSMSEAVRDYPELIKKYLGSVVPYTDNFYAALNAARVIGRTHKTSARRVFQCLVVQDRVMHLRTGPVRRLEAQADFHALDGLYRHDRLRDSASVIKTNQFML